MITFFHCDDSIQIFDVPKRNSGFISGKFLERNRYRNTERNNDWFKISDFMEGTNVKVNGYTFTILEADEATKKW